MGLKFYVSTTVVQLFWLLFRPRSVEACTDHVPEVDLGATWRVMPPVSGFFTPGGTFAVVEKSSQCERSTVVDSGRCLCHGFWNPWINILFRFIVLVPIGFFRNPRVPKTCTSSKRQVLIDSFPCLSPLFIFLTTCHSILSLPH